MSVILLQTWGCFTAMHHLQCIFQVQKSLRCGSLASGSWLLLRTCRTHSSFPSTARPSPEGQQEDGARKDFSSRLATGPTFEHFLRSASVPQEKLLSPEVEDPPPYLTVDELLGRQRKGWFYFSFFGLSALLFSSFHGLILNCSFITDLALEGYSVRRLLSYRTLNSTK